MYEEACFSQRNFYKWAILFKEIQNSIQDEDRPGSPIIVSTPEIVDSVKVLILTDRKVTIENISEELGISVGTTHKIVYDNHCFF